MYTPLPSQSFRLLTILPALSTQDQIHCTSSTHSLISPPPYTALSYTWGSPYQKPVSIILNSCCFPVKQNLHAALSHIRQHDVPVTLWVDAICINQDDLDERMDQVTHMHTIYRGAADVVIWLGLPSQDSSLALDFVLELPSLLAQAKSSATEQRFLGDPMLKNRWVAIGHLLMRPWWRRIWIIQEITLACTARILVGTRSIPWSSMHAVLSELRHDWQWATLHADIDRDTAAAIRLASMSRSVFDILTAFRAAGQNELRKADLGALMKITHSFKSTDPRDKVYALLGLTDDHTRMHIQPDYRKSVADVYRDTFTYLYARHGDLRDFSWLTGQAIVHDAHAAGPSWIPDWRWCNANNSFSWTLNNPISWIDADSESAQTWWRYRAGDPVLAGLPSFNKLKFSDDKTEMTISGVQVDTITHIDTYMLFELHDYSHNRAATPPAVEKLRAEAEAGKGTDTDPTPYIAGDNSRSAHYRTLLLDCQVPYIDSHSGVPRHLPKLEPITSPTHIPPTSAKEVDTVLHAMSESLGLFHGRCFAVTSRGYVGVVPRTASIGDWVCVLLGGEVPFVLREIGNSHYRMVGECFLHGIMDGEIMEQVKSKEIVLREFLIR